jgi:5-methylcytosine-specific restriction protein A
VHRFEQAQRYDDERGTAAERGYDAGWRDARLLKLKRNPICEPCEAEGRTNARDLLVHHVVPVEADPSLRLAQSNLLTVCAGCHARIHAALAAVN